MRRAATPVAVGLATLGVVACTILSPPDPRLCSAAQNLSAALTLTTTAMSADAAADVARAQGLATHARSLAELANATLHRMPDAEHEGEEWQALLNAYGQIGQAANSLLPAYAESHDMGPELLNGAMSALAKARPGLPGMCFDVPADLETPGPS